MHRVIARWLVSEFGHCRVADRSPAGAIDKIERRRLRYFWHRQWLSKPTMRDARGRHENIFCCVGHSFKNTSLRGIYFALERSKCFQPRLQPTRKSFCVCRKPCVVRGIKVRPVAKTQSIIPSVIDRYTSYARE